MTQSRAPLIVGIVLVLLPVLYVGSYFVMVLPQGRVVYEPWRGYRCHYRVDSDTFLPRMYWPLAQIDRMVRPRAWKPDGRDVYWAEFPP